MVLHEMQVITSILQLTTGAISKKQSGSATITKKRKKCQQIWKSARKILKKKMKDNITESMHLEIDKFQKEAEEYRKNQVY